MNSSIPRNLQWIINSISELYFYIPTLCLTTLWNVIINPVAALQALTSESACEFC